MFNKNKLAIFVALTLLSGCTALMSPGENQPKDKEYRVNPSYLLESKKSEQDSSTDVQDEELSSGTITAASHLRYIEPLFIQPEAEAFISDVTAEFSPEKSLRINADGLSLAEFLHYSLGELLKVSYILDESAKNATKNVTLNLQENISARKLFRLTQEILARHKYVLVKKDDIFYVIANEEGGNKGSLVVGIGNQITDIPAVSGTILQMVPFKFAYNPSVALVLKQYAGVKVLPQAKQSALFMQGSAEQIANAIRLLELVDTPNKFSKHMALIDIDYISSGELVELLKTLLEKEGLSVGDGRQNEELVLVNLERSNSVAVFAANRKYIERIDFWRKTLDVPPEGNEKRYFIFKPKYARAVDLGESLSPLLGGSFGNSNNSAPDSSNAVLSQASRTQSARNTRTSISASNDEISMVVDERSNNIIFHTSGEEYKGLLRIIKQLDILPKQVLLEVTIAEVTLKDDFKKGVEFALNNGSYGLTTRGSLGAGSIAGFSYAVTGSKASLDARFSQDDSLVNILSRPTLLVRDGTTASINVGNDIPTVGSTTEDPLNSDKQTTTIQYRKTGLEMSVTPTVTAQGVVVMEIKQSISNTIEDSANTLGSPSIFERGLTTEVVAKSGSTIILGGIISETKTKGSSEVPGLGRLPFLGHLFRSDTDLTSKTELVILVTPQVIDNNDMWQEINVKYEQHLENLRFLEK